MPLQELPDELDKLKANFTNFRAYFPYMSQQSIGAIEITTSPYYINQGFRITFKFSQPLSEASISKNNEIAGWINQNFIIRLWALLDSYSVTKKIDSSINGAKDVDLVRRLRNVFVHKNGRYDPTDSRHQKLAEELMIHLRQDSSGIIDKEKEFGLSIDTGIDPLFDGCKKYVQGLLE